MTDEDDDYAFYGTPLDQFDEEDVVPKKRPIQIQDQIVTDEHGRRRFHGAFTGGFSAGFFNTVGSLEGWKPASFKSSREKKADSRFQKPEDFMDNEDLDEFGIAPTVLRAKPEYSGASNRSKKRERVAFADGPIPGEPVLKSILEPVRETVGVLLLMKMGWKPGQGIGPRLSRLQKRREKLKNKVKIYGCSLQTEQNNRTESECEEDDDDDLVENIDPSVLFAPSEYEVHFLHPKSDTLGMGYSGIGKDSLYSTMSTKKSDTFRMLDNNKKLAIKGQAFGVGAFEDEDDDIYARDDMSQYDFALETAGSLREKRKKERENNRQLAIMDADNCLPGFVPARKTISTKKFFPPPILPADYEPVHSKRKTRFNQQPSSGPVAVDGRKAKHFITAHERAAILGDKQKNVKNEDQPPTSEDLPDTQTALNNSLEGFRPFIADPEKQQRYEKYLSLMKIGAQDAFTAIQPKSMDDWEKQREKNEFEQASRLYKPLSGMMAERFAHGELPDDSTDPLSAVPRSIVGEDPDMVEAAKSKMFGKLTRKTTDWAPCSVLCKRMNIAEPLNGSGVSLNEVAAVAKRSNRPKFSLFNFMNVYEENNRFLSETSGNSESNQPPNDGQAGKTRAEVINEIVGTNQGNREEDGVELKKNSSMQLPKSILDFDEPVEKKDLFKAIFCSDDDEEDEEEEKPDTGSTESERKNSTDTKTGPQRLTVANALRNTSPPRGIFANLDLDALSKRKTTNTVSIDSTLTVPTATASVVRDKNIADSVDKVCNNADEEVKELYGPSLPTKPVFVPLSKQKTVANLHSRNSSESSSEGEWVERKDDKQKKKRNKHKRKHKHKKKKKSK